MPRLQVFDALLLNDLNLGLGLFDALMCARLEGVSLRLKTAVGLRVALQLVGIALLIYYGRHHRVSTVGIIFLITAATLFFMTRHKLKLMASEQDPKQLGAATQWWTVYVVMYLLPVSGFLNLGVVLNPDIGKQPWKLAGWALQLTFKSVITAILVLYVIYYKLYAEAWHCYKRETDLSEYRYGYCPSYTHQGSYLDPSNIICRPDSPVKHRPCTGDRHADDLPRNWLAHGRWTYALLLIPVHITIVQAVAGINGVYALLQR